MRALVILCLFSLSYANIALAKEVVIVQKAKAFSQSDVTIAQGDTIVFKNEDDTSHNVFSTADSMKFNLGVQKPGTQATQKFDTAGEGEIRCAIHPQMKLKVKIEGGKTGAIPK